jgi:flagellar assembly protein FliH
LYKQRHIVANNNNARIINSNARVEERMQELRREMAQKLMEQQSADGFVEGLPMELVDAVPKEEEVSPEELLENARQEAEEILAEARSRAEAVLAQANEQAVSIRKQAEESGYESGYGSGLQEGNDKAEAELAVKRSQMEEEQRRIEEEYRQKIEELEPYLVNIVADVFEKVFHVQFDDKKEILIYLIQQTILNTEGTKDFQVRVSLKDYEFMENHKNEITERVGDAVHVEIMADASLKERQCMIETDSGVFDCGSDVQLDNLIKALRSLSL